MEQDFMFANKATITVGPDDAFLRFDWLVPVYGEDGQVTGHTTAKSSSTTMQHKTLLALKSIIDEFILDNESKPEA